MTTASRLRDAEASCRFCGAPLWEIVEQSGLPFAILNEAAVALDEMDLLRREPSLGTRTGSNR